MKMGGSHSRSPHLGLRPWLRSPGGSPAGMSSVVEVVALNDNLSDGQLTGSLKRAVSHAGKLIGHWCMCFIIAEQRWAQLLSLASGSLWGRAPSAAPTPEKPRFSRPVQSHLPGSPSLRLAQGVLRGRHAATRPLGRRAGTQHGRQTRPRRRAESRTAPISL